MTAIPDVPMQLLTALPLQTEHWKQIAQNASWQTTRMNLSAFARHGVFKDAELTQRLRDKLVDPAAIRKARAQPHQLMMAYSQIGADVPEMIREALHDAMEIATESVPAIVGRVVVCVDVSGSMQSPITGHRKGATTAVTCVQVAALIAACIKRTCVDAKVIAFSDDVIPMVPISRRDSVLTNARRLASLPSGGTNCSSALRHLNQQNDPADVVIYVSDNQSWVDVVGGPGTATMQEWAKFKGRCPRAKLVNIDLQPYTTSQLPELPDVLNVGGFNDSVFDVIRSFVTGERSRDQWVATIEGVQL
jgi:60 kDa SS-A/Ro ribonucleoprotein